MNKIYYMLLLVMFVSCQDMTVSVDQINLSTSDSGYQRCTDRSYRANLSASDISLDTDDAIAVATQYLKNNCPTKSTELINSVVAIPSDESPYIYAINLQDGYILISASKSYYPILAEVEHGRYSKYDNSASNMIINELADIVALSTHNEDMIDKCRSLWVEYEICTTSDNSVTKSFGAYQNYQRMLYNDYIPEWQADGFNFYFLSQKPELMPQSVYDSFCQEASDDMQEVDDFPYLYSAIILERIRTTENTVGPYTNTIWGQGTPYNALVPLNGALGCATIALGQIMKYYQYPTTYGWNDMPDHVSSSASCPVLASFLYSIREDNNADDGGTTIQRARRYLRNNGYNANIIDHNLSSVISSLNNGNPVYMKGEDSIQGQTAQHAWVCDGYQSFHQDIEYLLLFPIFDGDEVWYIEEYDSYSMFGNSYVRMRMNWGNFGVGNGYFLEDNTYVTFDNTSRNYTRNRKDILISLN